MFVHLHNHTEKSIQDSINKIPDCVKKIKELGMNACAITDHGAMYGVIDFYKAMKAEGLNPILGCEVYVTDGSMYEKRLTETGDRYYHLVLLAENNTGYQNLIKIISDGFTGGFWYRPRVDCALLEKYHEGIIALSGCLAGEITRKMLKYNNLDYARAAAEKYVRIFGKDNFFLELQDHGLDDEKHMNMGLIQLSKELGIPLVVTNDCHYTNQEDYKAHDVLLCISDGKRIDDPDRLRYPGDQFYVKSEQEMRELFPYAQEAVDNTQKIADRCHVEIEFHNTKIPAYPVPDGITTWEYLNKLCHDGLKERYPDKYEELEEQLDYELSVIHKMGYVEYFLIVWDFINWARKNKVPVGPGRGSAAGSLVSYTTGITNIDPIRYNLLFERFLNPERVSMPDIDVDFCNVNRYKVIEYVTEKYGKDCVSQIITFGTMAARQVIKDVGKAMGIPYEETNRVANMVPKEPGITLKKAIDMNPELGEYARENKELFDMCILLEGLPRQLGTHAAGVIISNKPLTEYIPICNSADGGIESQFTMTTVEELGLLKMDFLGLRTLTVIDNCVKNVANTEHVEIDIDKIDYGDPKVFAYMSSGQTDAVFQLESKGMQNFMQELKPSCLEDVIAGISLYRPGPMDFIPKYLEWKNAPSSIVYDCPQMRPILEPTYGCIVYQEQVMQIVRDLAGYTLGRSDLVRRAMSKKKASVMEKERKNFVYGNKEEGVPGCIANGISEQVANKIYDDMTDFAKYAFNKSHAAAYAVVSYQTAWLKYYYPKEFMAAVMTSSLDIREKMTIYIKSVKESGIRILPPDIQKSFAEFSVENDAIRFGLAAIAGISFGAASSIRNLVCGTFMETVEAMQKAKFSKKMVESLIKSGAFQCFGGKRSQYLSVYEKIMDNEKKSNKKNMEGQMSLFDLSPEIKRADSLPDIDEADTTVLLQWEEETCGVYLTGHPIQIYHTLVQAVAKRQDIMLGLVREVRFMYTKRNKRMCFFKIETMDNAVDCILFPRECAAYGNMLHENAIYAFSGKYEEEGKYICTHVYGVKDVPANIWIRFPAIEAFETSDIAQVLKEFTGGIDECRICIGKQFYKSISGCSLKEESILDMFRKKYGCENVAVTVSPSFGKY